MLRKPRGDVRGAVGNELPGAEGLREQNQEMKSGAQMGCRRGRLRRQKKEGGFRAAACRMAPKTRMWGRAGERGRERLRQVRRARLRMFGWEEKNHFETRDLPRGKTAMDLAGPWTSLRSPPPAIGREFEREIPKQTPPVH